jgi:hypothetical protein
MTAFDKGVIMFILKATAQIVKKWKTREARNLYYSTDHR